MAQQQLTTKTKANIWALSLGILASMASMTSIPAYSADTPNSQAPKPNPNEQIQADLGQTQSIEQDRSLEIDELKKNKTLLESLLNKAIEKHHFPAIQQLLELYQSEYKENERDEILVLFAQAQLAKAQGQNDRAIHLFRQILAQFPELNPVRIELAILLFKDQQNVAAKDQFEKVLSDKELPDDIRQLVQTYVNVLQERLGWQFNLSATPLREKNVNHVSDNPRIENTPFIKGQSMLPQKAHGIGYFVGLERDFNLKKSHYLHVESNLYGKSYWDKHDYDDITSRTAIGYTHKNAKQQINVAPFYERQWYGGMPYKQAWGLRGEVSRWVTPNWQLSASAEWGKEYYRDSTVLNGNNKSLSTTALWRRTPRQFFYGGLDFSRQNSKEKQYSYQLNSIRMGWGQEWKFAGLSSRFSVNASKRDYKDNLILGRVFKFDRKRSDKIYSANITLWKRDWHILGITPKLTYQYRKQKSNFDSLYSYKSHNLTVMFDKTF